MNDNIKIVKENNDDILIFNGLKLLYGEKSFPGGGHIDSGNYQHELRMFDRILKNITKNNPVMFEIGCHWALWSLIFRQKYPLGSSIIVDIGKSQLSVGIKNFEINNMNNLTHYHGSFFRNSSETYERRDTQLTDGCGEDLDFFKIFEDQGISEIDLLHMDIQGSELDLVESIKPLLTSKKIINCVVCTHDHLFSTPTHKKIVDIFINLGYKVKIDINSLNQDDGYIYAHC